MINKCPKVLIAAPQHSSKAYCFEDWYMNVKQFTYPNADILLVDNSDTDEFFNYMKQFDLILHRIDVRGKTTLERMTESHNVCRQYALDNNYDYLLHLETDVFPQFDVIDNFLCHGKGIIGATYSILSGAERELCIRHFRYDKGLNTFDLYAHGFHTTWLGQGVQKVGNCGLGCTLIRRDILSKIKFRYVVGEETHPDTWLAHDLAVEGIDFWNDTNIFVDHRNHPYGWHNLK